LALMAAVTVVLGHVAPAAASVCCTPPQWEGYQGATAGWSGRHKRGGVKEFASVHYDATNKQKAVFMTLMERGFEKKVQVISKCEEGENGCRVYVVDLKKDKCWTKKKECGFREACIPDDAKAVGEFSLGLKGGFNVKGFEVRKRGHFGGVEAEVTVADIGNSTCVPVGETVTGMVKRVGFMQTVGFIDITPGIKNATVFDVPAACKEDTDPGLEAEFDREHFVLAV